MRTDKNYGWPTVRCYPRTLAEAFPKDPEHMRWWFPPERHRSPWSVVLGTVGVTAWLWLAWAYWRML